MLVVFVFVLIFLDFDEFDIVCIVDIVFSENKSIVMCIIVVLEFILIFLIFVFYCMIICSFKWYFLNMLYLLVFKMILENRKKKFLKLMKFVNRLFFVLFIFLGLFLVCNFIEIFMFLLKFVLFVIYVLININFMVNFFIYFINFLEFKIVIRCFCFLSF